MAGLLPRGTDISLMLKADWPVIKCVILRASSRSSNGAFGAKTLVEDSKQPGNNAEDQDTKEDEDGKRRPVLVDMIDEIDIDLSPPKQSVATILGGAFTFAGQYEDEGVVLMVRNTEEMEDPNDLPQNPHLLQPPLDKETIRGDILIMKVAATEEEEEELDDEDAQNGEAVKDVPQSNTEFFLSYTKDEYVAFAARTDVVSEIVERSDVEWDEGEHCTDEVDNGEDGDEDGEVDGEEDGDDEEDEEEGDDDDNEGEEDEEFCIGDEEAEERTGILNMLMASLLRRFRDDNGRGPNTQEVLDIRQALASKMGFELEDIPPLDEPAAKKGKPIIEPTDPMSPYRSILTKRRVEDEDDDAEEVFPITKKVKFGAEIEAIDFAASAGKEGEKKGEC